MPWEPESQPDNSSELGPLPTPGYRAKQVYIGLQTQSGGLGLSQAPQPFPWGPRSPRVDRGRSGPRPSPGLTGLRALLIRGDIGVDELLLHLLRPLLEQLHQLLEPVVDDGAVLAGRRGRTALATVETAPEGRRVTWEGTPRPWGRAEQRLKERILPPFSLNCFNIS